MTEEPRRSVPLGVRLFAELAVIILGVLIALTADTWRESQQEAADGQRHLGALRDDMAESVAALRQLRATRDAIEHGLLQLLNVDLATASPDSVSTWMYQGLLRIGGYEPRVAALKDLEATGEVRLLSPEIRLGVAELSQRLGEFRRLEDDLMESQQGLVDPFLVSELPLASVLSAADSLPISARMTSPRDWDPLGSAHARSLMAFKLGLMKIATQRGEDLEEQMLDLLEQIEGRLSEPER